MFWLTLLPICGGIGASLALQGSILGAVVFIVLFNVVHLGLRFGLAHYAYRMGVAAIPLIKANKMCIRDRENIAQWPTSKSDKKRQLRFI